MTLIFGQLCYTQNPYKIKVSDFGVHNINDYFCINPLTTVTLYVDMYLLALYLLLCLKMTYRRLLQLYVDQRLVVYHARLSG